MLSRRRKWGQMADQDTSRKRIDWIDAAKGIGILLVVAGHVMLEGGMAFPGSDVARDFIYSFHMPLFFMISGVLLGLSLANREADSAYVGQKSRSLAKRLLVPFFIWSVIYFLLGHGNLQDTSALVKSFASMVTFRGQAPIWFLGALFWAEVFALLIVFISKKRVKWVLVSFAVVVLLACAAWWFYNPDAAAPMYLKYLMIAVFRGLVCLLFVLAGYLASPILLKEGKASISLVAFLASAGESVAVFALFDNGCNLHTFRIVSMPVFIVSGLSGSLAVLYLCKALCALVRSRILVVIGQETLGVMCIHYRPFPFMAYASDICAYLSVTGFAAFLLSFAFVFGCAFSGTKLLKRCPIV